MPERLYGSDVDLPMSGPGRRRETAGARTYICAQCGNAVFRSRERYPARTLWPVFWAPIGPDRVRSDPGRSQTANAGAVLCSRCALSLGFMLADGRPPTGMRYFINPAVLLVVEHRTQVLRTNPERTARTGSSGPACRSAHIK